MKKLFLLLFLLAPVLSHSQGMTSDGKDFFIGWLYPSYNTQSLGAKHDKALQYFGVYVLISSYTDNNEVKTSFFDDKGNEISAQLVTVQQRRSVQIPIERNRMRLTQSGEIPEYRAMHITSKNPVSVQFFSTGANSGGSYLAIPTHALGKNYVVETYHDNTGGAGGLLSSENASGYFMVVAAFDGTNIEITPNSTTLGFKRPGVNCGSGANGTPQGFTLSLQRGQCYMVKSKPDEGCNISGSTVISDKPVAVIAGHENAITDASDVGTISVEMRDFMVEQMIPVEYWDSIGYVSIPMVDGKNAAGGDGDEYQFFYGKPLNAAANYPKGASIVQNPGGNTFYPNQYPSATSFKMGVVNSWNVRSINRTKINVVQYDQRMQGSQVFPCPSQMSIIPISRWKTSYLWHTPSNTNEILQGYFINVIADKADWTDGTLQVAIDNKPFNELTSAFVIQKTFTIPDRPDLIGAQLKTAPGTFYATSTTNKPFIVYNYGFRAIDPNGSLGNFDGGDHFFSFASPAGFAAGKRDSSFFKVQVDTFCGKWVVCVSVSGANSPKLKHIGLITDPYEDFYDKLPTGKSAGYVSKNVQIDPIDDPLNNGEINLPERDSVHCFTIRVDDLDSAYAPIAIADNNGNSVIIELRSKALDLKDTITSSDFNLLQVDYLPSPDSNRYRRDSIFYPIAPIGKTHCATITYENTGDSDKGAAPIGITAINLGGTDGSFTITSTPSMPVVLRPRSSTRPANTLEVTVCFTPKDTAVHIDTMTITTDCIKSRVLLYGRGGTPLIEVGDLDFGNITVGKTKCMPLRIKNVGTLPFTLTKNMLLSDTVNFSVDPASLVTFPKILYPTLDNDHIGGDFMDISVCYTPHSTGGDFATIEWNTDIKNPYTKQVKSSSTLRGNGVTHGVVWDRVAEVIFADSIAQPEEVVHRVYMLSVGPSPLKVDKVLLAGPEAFEFAVVGNQAGFLPFEGFYMNPGDTIWVDIAFRPDYSRPYPKKFAVRYADLTALYFTDQTLTTHDTSVIHLTGTFNKYLSVSRSSDKSLKAYLSGKQIIVELPNSVHPPYDCALYDLLGRKVKQWSREEIVVNSSALVLAMPQLSDGVYVLRLNSDQLQLSTTVMINKD